VSAAAAAADASAGSLAPALTERLLRGLAPLAVGRRGIDGVHRRLCDGMVRAWRRTLPPRRRMDVGGATFVVELSERSIALAYLGRGPYEPLTAGTIRDRLGSGMTFVDVGANRGLFTLLGASCVGPTGHVLAVEPNPSVVNPLRAHIAWNGFSGWVQVVQAALTDREGEAELTLPTDPTETALASLQPSPFALTHRLLDPARTVRVRTMTFDALVAGLGRTVVDLVKIDAENAEDLVIGGMRETLQHRPPRAVICETAPDSDAYAALQAAGYAVTSLDVSAEGHGNHLFTAPERPALA
jgi:FkbM family methyltransferase